MPPKGKVIAAAANICHECVGQSLHRIRDTDAETFQRLVTQRHPQTWVESQSRQPGEQL